jgi:hypothetical protein
VLSVYNSAGELVSTLGELSLAIPPSGLEPINIIFVPDLGQIGSYAMTGTSLLLEWDGRSDAGQFVASGLYSVIVRVENSLGRVDSYAATMTVIRSVKAIQVDIFNSAGELVASIPSMSDKVGGGGLSVVSQAQSNGTMLHTIRFGERPEDQVQWNEHADQGKLVDQGVYLIKVRQMSNQGVIPLMSGSLTVLRLAGDPLELVAWPNPLLAGADLQFSVPAAQALRQARLYNLAGELVAWLGPDTGNSWTLPLVGNGLSSGVYVLAAEIESLQGDRRWVKTKIALIR